MKPDISVGQANGSPQSPPGQSPQARPPNRAMRRLRTALVVAAVLAAAIAGPVYGWLGKGPGGIAIGGPFQLTDQQGHAVTERSWPGKYLLVYFGYTFCPDVCPTTLSDLAAALDRLGAEADRVQPLFITVDPRRDTPAVLANYTASFTPRLVGLTGTAEQIAQVAKEYRVYYAEHRTGPGPDDYSMDHSSIIYLMAPDGHFVATIPAEQSPVTMASDISQHLP